jgi:ATP-dependent RNA helicase RhlE
MPPQIRNLANSLLHQPVKIEVTPVSSTVEIIDQRLFMVDKKDKQSLLVHLIKEKNITRSLVFVRTKSAADKVARALNKANIKADALHGDKSQPSRQRALLNFKTGWLKVLVATDIAARGIDVDDLSHVINFDIPNIPETYVHRIGRTGRAGASGIAFSFCDHEEKGYLKDIIRLTNKIISLDDHPFERLRPQGATHIKKTSSPSFAKRRNDFKGKRRPLLNV